VEDEHGAELLVATAKAVLHEIIDLQRIHGQIFLLDSVYSKLEELSSIFGVATCGNMTERRTIAGEG